MLWSQGGLECAEARGKCSQSIERQNRRARGRGNSAHLRSEEKPSEAEPERLEVRARCSAVRGKQELDQEDFPATVRILDFSPCEMRIILM